MLVALSFLNNVPFIVVTRIRVISHFVGGQALSSARSRAERVVIVVVVVTIAVNGTPIVVLVCPRVKEHPPSVRHGKELSGRGQTMPILHSRFDDESLIVKSLLVKVWTVLFLESF
jgi:hypothetical protein